MMCNDAQVKLVYPLTKLRTSVQAAVRERLLISRFDAVNQAKDNVIPCPNISRGAFKSREQANDNLPEWPRHSGPRSPTACGMRARICQPWQRPSESEPAARIHGECGTI